MTGCPVRAGAPAADSDSGAVRGTAVDGSERGPDVRVGYRCGHDNVVPADVTGGDDRRNCVRGGGRAAVGEPGPKPERGRSARAVRVLA
ncbi:hypothetical protein GCM10027605_41200 [Micromonospora zhanjiangensis]